MIVSMGAGLKGISRRRDWRPGTPAWAGTLFAQGERAGGAP
jgi:hypothetical protein